MLSYRTTHPKRNYFDAPLFVTHTGEVFRPLPQGGIRRARPLDLALARRCLVIEVHRESEG